MQRVLIIAGGTGGHIFPGLAVAQALTQQQIDVQWLGSEIGLERQLVSPHYPLTCIAAKRVRGTSKFTRLLAPFHLVRAIWQAWRAIQRLKPNVVLAMGGFVCAPGGIAAKLARKPLVIHEQNAVSGYTNRMLARFADKVLSAFPNTFVSKLHPQIVGNPVRAQIAAIAAPEQRLHQQSELNLLILGGSQGARAINQLILGMLQNFPQPQQLHIWHQTGKLDYEQIQRDYLPLGMQIKVSAFITDMVGAYEWADLVICRSGALTVAELAAAGVASILIPFPYAVDDHQWHNGQYLAAVDAAILLREAQVNAESLSQLVQQLMQNRPRLLAMATQARLMAKPDATQEVVKILQQVAAITKKINDKQTLF